MKENKDINTGKRGFWRELLTALPFVIAVALTVLVMPRGNVGYKYQFEIGKPWQYDLLTATYDFPIYKSESQIREERDAIINRHIPYFTLNKDTKQKQLDLLTAMAATDSSIAVYENSHELYYNIKPYAHYLVSQLERIYSAGLMSDADYSDCISKKAPYIVVTDENINRNRYINNVYSVADAKALINGGLPSHLHISVINKIGLDNILVPNLLYDNELTTKIKSDDLNNLSTTSGMVQAGERIIDTGEIVTEQKFNILDSLRRESQIRDEGTFTQRSILLVGQILLVSCLFALLYIYLRMFRINSLQNWRYIVMTLSLMVIFLAITNLVARLGRNFYFYAIPYALLPVIVSIFGNNRIDTRTGLFAHIITVLIASFQVQMPYVFVLLQIAVGMVTINSIKDFSQRSQFVRTAAIIIFSYFVLYFGYVLIIYNDITMFDWSVALALGINGLLLMLAYPLIFLIEKLFKFTSNVTLLELTNTNNPVLRELSEKAPGTFQHSMSVSNLAAEVAETIGANPLLTRTGALYHDIGKLGNPAYFTENTKNVNLHERLTPEQSAQIIIKHVTDGVAIAKQHQLPGKVVDFIKTHHGKSITRYFYNTWVNEHPGETPDVEKFTYPGPNPSTKEQGILMICDSLEAASRSLPEYTEDSINNLVDKLVNTMVTEHYLDDVPLTLQELSTIKQVVKERLHSVYHTRISYPELKNQAKEGEESEDKEQTEADENPKETLTNEEIKK